MANQVRNWIQTKLFEQAPFCICVINRDFRIIEANPMFEQTYGQWEGRYCHSVYKKRNERCEHCGAADTFCDGQVRVREEQGIDRDYRVHQYLVHMLPLVCPSGEISSVVEISTDITDIKQLEREKLEAERLAAVGQTVAGLAHGIKNIIMGLEGGMYVMGSGIHRNNNDRIKTGWAMLEENITRISFFAKEFLDFARGSKPEVALLKPNDIAQKVVELFADKATLAGIQLRFLPQPDIAEALMDEMGIHTCLSNLISNAFDACETSDKAERLVTLTTRELDGAIEFEVADNACGMDSEVKQKVFTNFFSTKGSGKGTGLGLLTTRRIVQEHGGTVSFETTEGSGSTFRLTFPRKRLPKLAPSGSQAAN